MKYIVQSTAVWDSIYLPGQEAAIEAPGGAGFYALAGMKVWEDGAAIVTGTGEDYLPKFKGWYEANGLDTSGLIVKDEHTPRTEVRYAPDGERTETPMFGIEHYKKIEAAPEEVRPFLPGACGVYVFKNTAPAYWEGMLRLKDELGFRLMWEIAADAAIPEHLSAVRSIAERTDVFSINRTEALTMLGASSVGQAVDALSKWRSLIYLRLGSEGVGLIRGGERAFVPSVPGIQVADSTGGGNSSSGGALIGYCRGCSLEEIGAMGNVSASFCIEQWGVPARFDARLRAEAERRKQQVLIYCRGHNGYEKQ